MRLLNTSTLEVQEFYDERIPDYAILSHTWGDREVTLQDLAYQPALQSLGHAGYKKIKGCCKLAASDGWEWVWIDTCCIDKTSSAELSEAINSMYRWYQKAEVCYAYLSDLDWKTYNDDAVRRRDFGSVRWFTRGWTLQELVAPGTVIFYDKHWVEIGTKWSLKDQVAAATGITWEHMMNPKDACIAAKFSWAAKRRTSRIEDIAYCLLGLFELTIPLLYGEGERAFMRLQREILQVYGEEDETLYAWISEGLASSGMLAPSPDAFAGSGNIVPVKHSKVPNHPFQIGKKALVIPRGVSGVKGPQTGDEVLDILPHHHNTPVIRLALNCEERGNEGSPIGIYLAKDKSHPHVYFRAFPGGTFSVCPLFRPERGKYRPIQVWLDRAVKIQYPVYPNLLLRPFRTQGTMNLVQKYPENLKLVPTPYMKGVKVHWEAAYKNDDYGAMLYTVNGNESFALILDERGDNPSLHVIVPESSDQSNGNGLERLLEPYREDPHHDFGADSFVGNLQAGSRLCVSLRRRKLSDEKVDVIDVTIDDAKNRGENKRNSSKLPTVSLVSERKK